MKKLSNFRPFILAIVILTTSQVSLAGDGEEPCDDEIGMSTENFPPPEIPNFENGTLQITQYGSEAARAKPKVEESSPYIKVDQSTRVPARSFDD